MIKEENEEEIINNYLNSFDDKQRKAYDIAQKQLGILFSLKKSNGYLQYKKLQKDTK
jgi:hypothetical protein